jgi:Reverse transcriptase (RNA-dependent DNA polymerase)
MRKNTEAQVSGGVADGSVEGSVMGLERSSDVVRAESVGQPGNGEEPAKAVKPFGIAKRVVWEAYRHVKANRGAAGIDGESIEMFEANLKDNLYRLWNRMSSGSYMPPAIRLVEIPKKSGGVRTLGIATIEDRIAQTVAKTYIEPALEQLFHPDSYGYRPNKSALQAVGVTRERCWKYDWVIEFDIHKAFDELDWTLLLRAVRKHVKERWAVLYIERWLKVSFVKADGTTVPRSQGVPQGSVIGPVLMNLFMHYCAPGQTWCFQRVKFPPRQEVQPPYRESSLGFVKATTRTKRRQSDERAVTKVKLSNLVKYLSAGRQRSSGWQAPVGSPQMAMVAGDCGGVMSTARSEMEASRDLGDPPRSWFAPWADRVCRTIWLTPENGRRRGAKSDSLVVLRARESRVHGEAAKQMKTGFGETSPAPTEAGV